MADFKTHIAGSSLLGVAYGGVAYVGFGVPASTCILAGGLCSLSGMLPDIDSGPGRPLREISLFLAAVVPTMLFDRFQRVGLSPESIILIGATVYLAIRFGLVRLLKRFTVHRGMFHSLPAAIIFGELAFLLASGDDTQLRWYKAGGVVLGYLCHLVLDEVYAVQWNGVPRVKKSFGTALKIVGNGWWPNLSTYVKLAVLTVVVIEEPGLMYDLQGDRAEQRLQQIARELPDRLPVTIRTPPLAEIPTTQPNGQPSEPEATVRVPSEPVYYTAPEAARYHTTPPPPSGAAGDGSLRRY